MDTLMSTIYIDYLLSDKNISLIEVWDNKLFIWRYKGRPTFVSALGLEFTSSLYYRLNEYKKISKKYHPDISKSKSNRVSSGEIQALINDVKSLLEVQSGGYNAEHYIQYYEEFTKALSCKNHGARDNFVRELSSRLYDCAEMVQDRFSVKAQIFEALLQEMAQADVRGEDIKNGFRELFKENRENSRLRNIRNWNQASSFPDAKKDNKTVYGEAGEGMQQVLRRQYGDVFAIHVGGPCDTSPL